MKKLFGVLLTVVMLASLFCVTSCGGDDYGEGYTFKHGFDMEYPPYSYMQEDGSYGGFDIELCQAVCEYYGWEYEPVPINWDTKKAELDSGAIDCIWSGFTIEGLEDLYAWSNVYSNNSQVILVVEGSTVDSIASLAGKKVGVQRGTSGYALLTEGDQKELKESFASLEVYDDFTVAVTALKAGAIDAVAIDITAANYYKSLDSSLIVLDEVLGAETYGIGFRTADTELRDKVNDAITALYNDGTFAKIAANYPDIADYLCWETDK